MGSYDDAGPHERAWLAAGGLAWLVAELPEPLVLALPGGSCPVLLLPGALALPVPREILFGWARTELGIQRCGWRVSDLRLRQLVLNRVADRRPQSDVA